MKVLYIYIEEKNNLGVIKKVEGQVKALKKLENEVDILSYSNKKMYLNEKMLFNIGNKYIKRFLFFIKLKKLNLDKYNLIYLRSPGINPCVISFLKTCKEKYKNQKIILEIPTYPYDKESFNIMIKIYNYIDKFSRRKLYKYIDKIVTYSSNKKIFNVPCINIFNGIDFDRIELVKKSQATKNKTIVFTSVSLCFFWHGIDRFLYSLLEFKKNNLEYNVIFNIVGEGAETSNLKKIVNDNPLLKDCVIFHGFKSEKKLDEIYNQTDVAIGSLGSFRKNVYIGSALKNREYCAKGLPFILAEKDVSFTGCPFVLNVSPNEELIDINKIINWYKNLKITSKEIRRFAEENLTWNIQMKKVIDYILEIEEKEKC